MPLSISLSIPFAAPAGGILPFPGTDADFEVRLDGPIFVHGPAAAGKRTVGRRVATALDLALFHNHRTVDLVASTLRLRHARSSSSRAARKRRSSVARATTAASRRPNEKTPGGSKAVGRGQDRLPRALSRTSGARKGRASADGWRPPGCTSCERCRPFCWVPQSHPRPVRAPRVADCGAFPVAGAKAEFLVSWCASRREPGLAVDEGLVPQARRASQWGRGRCHHGTARQENPSVCGSSGLPPGTNGRNREISSRWVGC